ncbi:hypothetical protein B0T22DRAFT_3497 [Podospora appendiculata]|uniref:Uncharacterized protein n=1 Tax=Podospora appendiculata TaxID=314037 RepID=A0AAE0XEW8_9PEZI|nr:hypothetical protein B0T22DRAFT_3497 [Podospora appendiculata]
MPADDTPPRNPFVRFKHYVDNRVSAGLQSVFGLPSVVSRTFSLPAAPSPDDNSNNTTDTKSAGEKKDPSAMAPRSLVPTSSSAITNNAAAKETPPSQHEDPALESKLDQLRGGTFDDHQQAWSLFATYSEYSPLRLSAELGWEPTPNDLPPHYEPELFGWTDAFEDLLAASSAKPMMSLADRYLLNQLTFPSTAWRDGNHNRSAQAWLNRLRAQGLTEVYFPFHEPHVGYRSPQTMQEWVEARRAMARAWPDEISTWTAWHDEFEKFARQVDERGVAEGVGGLFPELGKAIKVLGRVLEDEVRSFPFGGGGKRRDGDTAREGADGGGDDKETEEDLYAVIQSAFRESERSLASFIRSFAEGAWRGNHADEEGEERREVRTWPDQQKQEKGTQTHTSRSEFVDDEGNAHVRTETTRTRADGTEVYRETSYTVRPATRRTRSSAGGVEEETEGEEEALHKKEDEKTAQQKAGGWFWK